MDFPTLPQVLVVVAAFSVVLGVIAAAKKAFTRTPPLHDEFASKSELGSVERRLSGEIEDLDDRLTAMRSEIVDGQMELRRDLRADIGGVHERINLVLASVSELKGRIER